NLVRVHVSDLGQAFPDRGRHHMHEFGKASPRLFERNLAGVDPFAAVVHKTSFGEIVDGAADCGTGGCRIQSNARNHAGGDDGYGFHASVSSTSSISSEPSASS